MSTISLKSKNQQELNGKSQLTKLYEIIRESIEEGFYGSIEVKFEAGKITIVRKTESIKI